MVKSKGFTLIELMITLVIVAIVLSLGLITMRGYIPKQRLTSSRTVLTNLIQRAQAEANARSYWTCITLTKSGDLITATLFADTNGSHADGLDTKCGDENVDVGGGVLVSDQKIVEAKLKDGVEMNSCGGKNVEPGCVIWFDTAGSPQKCTGTCPSSPVGNVCVDDDVQIVLSNPRLGENARAKEIEVMRGGLVNNPKIGERGLNTLFWAAAPVAGMENDKVGACE